MDLTRLQPVLNRSQRIIWCQSVPLQNNIFPIFQCFCLLRYQSLRTFFGPGRMWCDEPCPLGPQRVEAPRPLAPGQSSDCTRRSASVGGCGPRRRRPIWQCRPWRLQTNQRCVFVSDRTGPVCPKDRQRVVFVPISPLRSPSPMLLTGQAWQVSIDKWLLAWRRKAVTMWELHVSR